LEESGSKESDKQHNLYKEQLNWLKTQNKGLGQEFEELKFAYKTIEGENRSLKRNILEADVKLKKNVDIEKELSEEILSLKTRISEEAIYKKDSNELLQKLQKERVKLNKLEKDTTQKTDVEKLLCKTFSEKRREQIQIEESDYIEIKERKHTKIDQTINNFKKRYDSQTKKLLKSFHQELLEKEIEGTETFNKEFVSPLQDIKNIYESDISKNHVEEEVFSEQNRRFSELVQELKKLEKINEELNKKFHQMEEEKEDQTPTFEKEMSDKEREVEEILHKIAENASDYEKLLVVKTGLDMEIAMYNNLVHSEEDRLGIVPTAEDEAETASDKTTEGKQGHEKVQLDFLQGTKLDMRKV
jgi:hypothetical protein